MNRRLLSPPSSRVLRTLSLAVSVALASACSSTRSPQSADTATSWLSSCVDDRDCVGFGSCLGHVCTLPCTRGASCAGLAAGARCEPLSGTSQSVCDLVCAEASDCDALGEGYACQAERCRPRTVVALSSQALKVEPEASAAEGWEPVASIVDWTGDRWRIAIVGRSTLETSTNFRPVIAAPELLPDGTIVESRFPTQVTPSEQPSAQPFPLSSWPMAVARDGTTATRLGSGNPILLPETSVQFVLPDGSQTPAIDCASHLDVAPLEQGSDWLVVCQDEDGSASLGRFSPQDERWSVPARPVVRDLARNERVFVATRGQDALLFRQHPTEAGGLALVPGAAARDPKPFSTELKWRALDATFLRTNEGRGYFFASGGLKGDWLVQDWYEQSSWGTPENTGSIWQVPLQLLQTPTGFRVSDDGRVGKPVRFPLSRSEDLTLRTAQALPERGLIGFCFVERHVEDQGDTGAWVSTLLFSLFDETGRRVSGPTTLASTRDAVHACDLTWSGSALLATWLQSETRTDGLGRSSVHARILSIEN